MNNLHQNQEALINSTSLLSKVENLILLEEFLIDFDDSLEISVKTDLTVIH